MGEFNDGTDVDKWLYDNIKEIGGSNFSVQVILYQTISIFLQLIQNISACFTDISLSKAYFCAQIMVTMFFIYGTIIIANLITAWIVVNQKDAETEIILAKQRVEEITGSSEVSKKFPKEKSKNCLSENCQVAFNLFDCLKENK